MIIIIIIKKTCIGGYTTPQVPLLPEPVHERYAVRRQTGWGRRTTHVRRRSLTSSLSTGDRHNRRRRLRLTQHP